MDDLSEKLAEILNDPESMQRVRSMAENLLGGEQQKDKEHKADINSLFGDSDLDIGQITKIMTVLNRLKSKNEDSRTQLLLALKPHLSVPKREKVDTAVKLLKLIDMLPIIKDMGLFDSL